MFLTLLVVSAYVNHRDGDGGKKGERFDGYEDAKERVAENQLCYFNLYVTEFYVLLSVYPCIIL
jgi:hypothetical protein